MNAVVAAEWHKLRTVRSTYFVLAFVLLAVAFGTLITQLMTQDFQSTPVNERRAFSRADMSPVILPFVQLAVATMATLVVTTEYSSGMIRTSLLATPRRGRLFAGKAVVVGGVGLAAGVLAAFGMALASWVIAGDQPPPLQPWPTFAGAIPMAAAATAAIAAVALVAYGLGVALRSTAAALVTVSALVFVLPVISAFLPGPWGNRVLSVSLPALPAQLAGAPEGEMIGTALSQTGAAVTMAVYVVVALGAGWLTLRQRDA